MSRWEMTFHNHPFQEKWQHTKELINKLEIVDQTIKTDIEELARLKQVIRYIDELLKSVTPELVPLSTWPNFQNQTETLFINASNYYNSRNISHLLLCNENCDNLLSYIKPYIIDSTKAHVALIDSIKEYQSQLEKKTESLTEKSKEITNILEEYTLGAKTSYLESKEILNAITEKYNAIFQDRDNEPSSYNKLIQQKELIDKIAADIKTAHSELISNEDSPYASIINVSNEAEKTLEYINNQLERAATIRKQLEQFQQDIFGTEEDHNFKIGEDKKNAPGLKSELEKIHKELLAYNEKQIKIHSNLKDQIQGLLPGATSAGLASAYSTLRRSFYKPIKIYTLAFYGSLSFLVLGGIFTSIDSISLTPLRIELIGVQDWEYTLRSIFQKAPFTLPAIWLAIFSAKRRSQYERLQQEYAHKEAISKSYDGYKKQILDIDENSKEMLKSLLDSAISTISFNASTTLDGKHDEKTPLGQILESIKPEDLTKLIESAKEKSKQP